MPMKPMFFLWSLIIAAAHSGLSIALGIYFGLGMSPKGAWFVKHVFMQPGVGIATILKRFEISQPDRLVLLINFVFYLIIFLLIFYLRQKLKDRSVVV